MFAALATFVYLAELRNDRLERNSARVRTGMSRTEAVAIMGLPSWDGACGTNGISLARDGCASEIGYSSWLAPVLPVYWVVELDRRGRVIEAYILVSP